MPACVETVTRWAKFLLEYFRRGGNLQEVVTNKYFATPCFWQTNVGQLKKLTNVRYATWAAAA